MRWKILQLPAYALLAALVSGPACAEGISREQGDIMISELRQIRQLLEKQQAAAPAAPAANPTPRVSLKLGKEPILGKSDAPITIVEYTDYQCPFCNRFYTTTFAELKKKYIDTGKVRFISRDYPLEFHAHAMKAAQATHCAAEQDKFWQMKDALMTNSPRLNQELITSLAKDTGLDMTKFQECLSSDRYRDAINGTEAAARALGINGTPSFVIGKTAGDQLDGYLVVGAQPLSSLENVMKKVESGN